MNIFNRKVKQSQIEQFELKIADLLKSDLPQLKKAIGLSKVNGINFMHNPRGMSVSREYSRKAFEEINRNHKTFFKLAGILVLNRESGNYESLKLIYHNDTLAQIETENPEYFHKIFDLNQIQKGQIYLDHLKKENPDREIANEALESLTKEQLDLLELESTFEIQFDETFYYTILDMEDGNYIAVDKKGKIYRLNHDHKERVKLLANNPGDFFKIYKGQKRELEKIMYE